MSQIAGQRVESVLQRRRRHCGRQHLALEETSASASSTAACTDSTAATASAAAAAATARLVVLLPLVLRAAAGVHEEVTDGGGFETELPRDGHLHLLRRALRLLAGREGDTLEGEFAVHPNEDGGNVDCASYLNYYFVRE